jgi:hypothetical protein
MKPGCSENLPGIDVMRKRGANETAMTLETSSGNGTHEVTLRKRK